MKNTIENQKPAESSPSDISVLAKKNSKFPEWDILPPHPIVNPRVKLRS